jgi:multidrug efflux pump subunit AcrB
VISRKNGKRFISLDLRFENAGEHDVMKAVWKSLKEIPPEEGVYYEFDEKHMEAEQNRLLLTASLALALFLSYVVLGTATNSFAWPLRMILVAPASLVGGAAFLAAGGYARSASVHFAIIMLVALSLIAPLLVVDELLRAGGITGETSLGRVLPHACAKRLRVPTAVTLVNVLSMAPVFLLSGPANFFAVMCGFVLSGEVSAFFIFLAVFPLLCPGEVPRRSSAKTGEG